MPKKGYDWCIGDEPPEIEPHSLAKHEVYEEYLAHYIRVLSLSPNIAGFQLALVDGFAGGGVYVDPGGHSPYSGSPSRLLQAAKAGEARANLDRRERRIRTPLVLQTEHFFVERKRSNYEHLKWHLSQEDYAPRFDKDIFLLEGEFTIRLGEIIQHIETRNKNCRCLFFLDQYGYEDVPFNDIRKIFSRLPRAEIVLTLATDALINYMSDDPRWRQPLERIGIAQEMDIEKLLEEKEENKDWRRLAQFSLHDAVWKQSRAGFYTPFFITSAKSHRSYWLIHLSNHEKARDVMTALHWRLKNHFSHYGAPGLWMLGYDPRKDSQMTGQIELFNETEYSFDETAKERTRQALIEELPKFIYRHPDGIPYTDLYRCVANTTPATSEHIKEMASLLLKARELEVRGPNNVRRRSRIEKGDILRCARQRTLFGPSALPSLIRGKGMEKR